MQSFQTNNFQHPTSTSELLGVLVEDGGVTRVAVQFELGGHRQEGLPLNRVHHFAHLLVHQQDGAEVLAHCERQVFDLYNLFQLFIYIRSFKLKLFNIIWKNVIILIWQLGVGKKTVVLIF